MERTLNFGYAIKLLREEQRLTKAELARKAQVSFSFISMLERGERNNPGAQQLYKIAKALDVRVDSIFRIAALSVIE